MSAQDEFNALLASQDNKHDTHPEDASISSTSSDPSSDVEVNAPSSDDDNDDEDKFKPNNTMPSATYHIPHGTSFDANTGPKGVIADAKSFEREKKRGFRQTLYAFSNGIYGTVTDKYRTSPSPTYRDRSSSRESSIDEEDDEFMRTWRAKRMTEMQIGGPDRRTRRQSPSKRRYGYVTPVDATGYLDAVEKVTSDTTVVVCIFDEESAISAIVEDALAKLAPRHEFTRFVKLSYEEAEIDIAAVPAIIAYRDGEIIANLVSLIDEIPSGRDLSAASLESLLRQYAFLLDLSDRKTVPH